MPDISRRTLLQGVTLTGLAGVGAGMGVGTHALASDGATFRSNVLRSGSLELEIAALLEYNGTSLATPTQDPTTFPTRFTSEQAIEVAFPEIESASGPIEGTMSLAFRACENPAHVWLRADDVASPLSEALDIRAEYTDQCGTAGTTVYDGSLSGFLDFINGGILLGGCSTVGTVEYEEGSLVVETETGTGDSLAVPEDIPGTLTFEDADESTTIRITDGYYKDESGSAKELIGVDIATAGSEICQVDVKGGGKPRDPGSGSGGSPDKSASEGGKPSDGGSDDGVVTYWPGCSETATGLLAGSTPAGTQSELSHFTIATCSDPCIGCEPACLVLDWVLKDPEAVSEESLRFDLELFANQCRNTEPTNPWS